RATTLTRPQDLQPVPLRALLPDVVGRAVNPEHPAGLTHALPASVIEHPQPVSEQHVILRHAAHPSPSSTWQSKARVSRRSDGAHTGAVHHSTTQKEPECRGPLGDSPP